MYKCNEEKTTKFIHTKIHTYICDNADVDIEKGIKSKIHIQKNKLYTMYMYNFYVRVNVFISLTKKNLLNNI